MIALNKRTETMIKSLMRSYGENSTDFVKTRGEKKTSYVPGFIVPSHLVISHLLLSCMPLICNAAERDTTNNSGTSPG